MRRKNRVKSVSISDYRISTEVFEKDIKFLKENGYTAVFVGDLVGYVYEGTPLPDKPIIITLDDGYLNNLTTVLPILEKYDMCDIIDFLYEKFESLNYELQTAGLCWSKINKIAIGLHPETMKDSETLKEFKDRVANVLKSLNLKFKPNDIKFVTGGSDTGGGYWFYDCG